MAEYEKKVLEILLVHAYGVTLFSYIYSKQVHTILQAHKSKCIVLLGTQRN